MMCLSIIVPVYNVVNFLKKCIDSIVNQDTNRCEIILVDDGSTDGSEMMCDEYSEKYSNVKTIHKSNGGLSDARNCGIEVASGEYLMFVDSDDYVKEGSLQFFINKIVTLHSDVYVGKSYSVSDDGVVEDELKYSISEGLYSFNEYSKQMRKNPKSVIFCAQYYICKRTIVQNNNLRFKKGIIHEDELWTPFLLSHCESIYYCDYLFYYHLMREGSIMHSDNSIKSGKSLLTISSILLPFYKGLEKKKYNTKYFRDRLSSFYLQAFTKMGKEYVYLFDKHIPITNCCYFKSFCKALLFFLSPNIYYSTWLKHERKNAK